MRFTEFSIQESAEWMERSDILFLLDYRNHKTPFISKSIIEDYEKVSENPYNIILDRIHHDDLSEFNKIVSGNSSRPAHHKLRITDKSNHTRFFSFHKLRIGYGKTKYMLLAISKKRSYEPVLTDISVNW